MSNILGIGRLESGRLPSDDPELKYRYKFKPESVNIFPLGIKLNDLHKYLSMQGINVGAPYTERQDWPIISDSYSALVLAWLKNKVFNIYNNI